jgi:dTDP-glucose 4,6-dehydratase
VTRALITGGAGFLGSHLCRRLLQEGWEVLCLDSLVTGGTENLEEILQHPGFSFHRGDVTKPIEVEGDVDWVLHLASPASPPDYLARPIQTLEAGSLGTLNCLELARGKDAAFFLASTSEIYGDPKVHPQPEDYWGNVNPVGPRSVYDEAKRFSEAAATAFGRVHGISLRIARIFNTYGPGMREDDGRALPTFVRQALRGEPLTVHGDGSQTRSLCYVDDMIDAFWKLLDSDVLGPVNLGNPEEVSVRGLAETVRRSAGSKSEISFQERPQDDPERRCPDISLAVRSLGWKPQIPLSDGLDRTVSWAREAWAGDEG